uniref:SCP2 domain-containing protein n=1 Tax=Arcella intermedia TaxID=1963864 RepID=A0A6B2LSV4_9EUKA|eukprot:TRINITY_DN1517_c1_g1_i1.p2 TRINITY_DN1517_c1_g1~~TRINITY_DN1517_c1_g1_i1.p2  ORF type:complete len:112 (+),score=7.55 TRINITY_DN1517_c1_g1_i1:39-374(+)
MALQSQPVFDVMANHLKNPDLLKKVNAVYQFNLVADGKTHTFTVDAKKEGTVKSGAHGKADCTITMADADFLDLSTGKMDGMTAFSQGKLKVSGNIMLAQKLNVITQQAKL